MKLIVAGATGFVGTEVIRQALSNPKITSVVALARREVPAPQDAGPSADASKLETAVVEDFGTYSEAAKQKLAGADACIWLVAITPGKSKTYAWEEVRKICVDYLATGIETVAPLRNPSSSHPFRFVYLSGDQAQRDPAKKPMILGDYLLMRGEAESRALAYANEHKGSVEACAMRPGFIRGAGVGGFWARSARTMASTVMMPFNTIDVTEIASAAVDQALNGFEMETYSNVDLVRIGQRALQR